MATIETTVPRFTGLIERMYAGDVHAGEELIQLLTPGLMAIIRRRVEAQDIEDALQNTLTDLLVAIKSRQLREAEALPGFARTVALRRCSACLSKLISTRASLSSLPSEDLSVLPSKRPDAEELLIEQQKRKTAAAALSQLSPREREVLRRFYLEEQRPEQICSDMSLTSTQFRLLKSRAKEKFGDFGRAIERKHSKRHAEYATAIFA